MKRKSILLLLVFMLGVGAILSLSVSDLSLLRPRRELFELSVIVRQPDSSTWAAARLGMEQAAGDLGVELRFLTLTTAGSAEEQRTLLWREVEGGADGIILAPADPEALADDVKRASERTCVLTLETDMSQSGAVACISPDNAALGKALGQAALNGVPPGGTVLLLSSALPGTGIAQRLVVAAQLLEKAGRTVERYDLTQEGELLLNGGCQAVIAFEPAALEYAIRAAKGCESDPPLLYGTGATATITAALEQGAVISTAAQNEFAVGYLAVEEAVQAARKKPVGPVEPMEFVIVRQESMYKLENQKLLFPVTQ